MLMNELANEDGRVEAGSRKKSAKSVTVLSSEELLDGRLEVLIEHNGDLYRLRHTRQGKLILTK